MPDMKLNLYENAIDSINHALEHYTTDSDLAGCRRTIIKGHIGP